MALVVATLMPTGLLLLGDQVTVHPHLAIVVLIVTVVHRAVQVLKQEPAPALAQLEEDNQITTFKKSICFGVIYSRSIEYCPNYLNKIYKSRFTNH